MASTCQCETTYFNEIQFINKELFASEIINSEITMKKYLCFKIFLIINSRHLFEICSTFDRNSVNHIRFTFVSHNFQRSHMTNLQIILKELLHISKICVQKIGNVH